MNRNIHKIVNDTPANTTTGFHVVDIFQRQMNFKIILLAVPSNTCMGNNTTNSQTQLQRGSLNFENS